MKVSLWIEPEIMNPGSKAQWGGNLVTIFAPKILVKHRCVIIGDTEIYWSGNKVTVSISPDDGSPRK